MLSVQCGNVKIFIRNVRNVEFVWFAKTLDIWFPEQNFGGTVGQSSLKHTQKRGFLENLDQMDLLHRPVTVSVRKYFEFNIYP